MNSEMTSPQLIVRQQADGLVHVGLAGDWIASAALPGLGSVEKQLTNGPGPAKALEFETTHLGRWNSGLMIFVLKCYELCERNKVEFRAQTLPPGVAKLIRLSQAAPDRKDAARTTEPAPFFRRLGESALKGWAGATGMLTFVGENVLAFIQLLRGRAQFRWADTFLVMQECGPRALGIVALINFLIGLILAFVG